MAKFDEKIAGTLPLQIENLLIWIHKITDLERFILYGGTPLDLLAKSDAAVNDLDIAVDSTNRKLIKTTQKNLLKNGFKLVKAERKYFINITEPVILVYAKNDKYFLDIAFLEKIESIGQFDLGSLYCRYPELDRVDKFHALEAFEKGVVRPIRDLNKENPYLLSSIFTRLCSKYNLGLVSHPAHREVIETLVSRLERWKPSNNFHKTEALASAISGLLKSIIISAQNRRKFIKELVESGLLKFIIPEIQQPLLEFDTLGNYTKRRLLQCKSKLEFVKILWSAISSSERASLSKRLALLEKRVWDLEDKKIGKAFQRKF